MPPSLSIQPLASFRAAVRPPGSKSLTNRALLLAALAQGRSVLHGPLLADDSRQMIAALRSLGLAVELTSDESAAVVQGVAGKFPPGADIVSLHLGNAGTAYRFLTAACCLGAGRYRLDGVPRMRQRPIGQLVEALHQIGGEVRYLGIPDYPPVEVIAHGLKGGTLTLPPTLSSQYISALLQVGPCCGQGLHLHFAGPVTSRPYVEMTLRLMEVFGVKAHVDAAFMSVRVEPSPYRAADYAVEPDASSASYFLAAAAVTPGSSCTIEGLGKSSLQGDVGFADVLHQMGAGLVFGRDFITVTAPPGGERLRGVDIDLNAMPDMALTLAAIAPLAKGITIIRNVGNLRVKETDRLSALETELTKVGAAAEIQGDDLFIAPPTGNAVRPPAGGIDTYDDHRMAMSFAVLGLAVPGIVINDPGCVDKTFPSYFEYLAQLGKAPRVPASNP